MRTPLARFSPRHVARACVEFWRAWFTWRSSIVVALLTVFGFWLFGDPLAIEGLDGSSPFGKALRATLAFELSIIYTLGGVMALRELRNNGIRRFCSWFSTTTGRSKIAKELRTLRTRLKAIEHRPIVLREWDEIVADTLDLEADLRAVYSDAQMGVPYARIYKVHRQVSGVLTALRNYLRSADARNACFVELGIAELDPTPSALCAVTVRFDATALDKAVLLAYARVGELPFDEIYPLRYKSAYLVYAPEALLHAWTERRSDLTVSTIEPCPPNVIDLAESLWSRDDGSIYHDPVRLVAAARRLDRASQYHS